MSKWILALVLACPIFAQDCILRFDFVASGQTTAFNNQQTQCTNWTLGYFSSGFSALSIQLESASPGANSSVPGTFASWAGSLVNGIHPSTNTAQAQVYLNGLYPWVRVNLTSATGTGEVIGAAYGYKVATQQFPVAGGSPCGSLLTLTCISPNSFAFANRFVGNGGTFTTANGLHFFEIQATNVSGDANGIYARGYPLPATPYSVIMAFSLCGTMANPGPEGGIYLTDGTKFVTFNVYNPNGNTSTHPQVTHCTGRTSPSCTLVLDTGGSLNGNFCPGPFYLKMVDDGVNVEMLWSANGYQFDHIRCASAVTCPGANQYMIESRTAFLTPTEVGYFAIPDNGNYRLLETVYSWVQGVN